MASAGAPAGGGPSEELTSLESLEKDIYIRLRENEKRIFADEAEYFSLSLQSDSAPSFGNIISGWEGLLEGRAPDKKRGAERIYSGACALARAAACACSSHASFHPMLCAHSRNAPPTLAHPHATCAQSRLKPGKHTSASRRRSARRRARSRNAMRLRRRSQQPQREGLLVRLHKQQLLPLRRQPRRLQRRQSRK